jgi:hypothetical protein
MKDCYHEMSTFFKLYNETNTRPKFVEESMNKFSSLTESESMLIWYAFDYAYEQWAIDPHSGDED